MCVFVCVPVRELEIEPCNKRCAFPDRIAETLTSSTAALPKKGRLMLLKMQSFFQRNTSENRMHLIIVSLLMVIMKTKVLAVVVSVPLKKKKKEKKKNPLFNS